MVRQNLFSGEVTVEKAYKNYVKSINKALLKIIAKMGISTIQSYRGAQIFEAIGLNTPLVEQYFTGTPSRVEGIGIEILARECLSRHHKAYPDERTSNPLLDVGGQYQWRREGEYHLFNPETVAKLQVAVRQDSFKTFREYSELINNQSKNLCTLRGLAEVQEGQSDSDRRSRACQGDCEAFCHGRHVVRFHQQGSARESGHRHEPHRRQEQHRRGW